MNRGFVRNLKLAGMWYINLNLALISYIIVWFDRKLKFPLPFPRHTADLATKEKWCVAILKKNGVLPNEAEVSSFTVTPLNQEIIYRSNIGLVEITYPVNGAIKNLKCIAKFAPLSGTVWNRTVFNVQLNHIKEIFFNKHFVCTDKEVPSPEVYYAEFSLLTGNLCLLMEYMEPSKEYQECVDDGITAEHLELVFNGMASLHARYWKDTSKRMEKVFPIIPVTVDFFDSMVAGKWSIASRKILVESWCRMNEPQTVVHGDARIGNMIFPDKDNNGRFVFIDWQAVRQGKGIFDLAYFLVLSLTTQKRKQVEQQAIETYYRLLKEKGVKDYSREELEEDYRHACLCVLVLLSLPMLSGEASAEGQGAKLFAYGMNIWRERVQTKFLDFDYQWMTAHYGLTENEGREAVAEMLIVIEDRLKRITG
ncbi:MAG: oxidoreductase family protein [Bacteroidota bacterium]